jgi:hypothetical protein
VRIVDRCPKSGYESREKTTPTGMEIEVRGEAQDRLPVLE